MEGLERGPGASREAFRAGLGVEHALPLGEALRGLLRHTPEGSRDPGSSLERFQECFGC